MICICDNCRVNYGFCEKFEEYLVNVGHPNKAHLISNDALLAQGISSKDNYDNVVSFLRSGSVVAIAADRKSIETIWFIKVIEAECVSENVEHGYYGHSIAKGVAYIKGCYLKRSQILQMVKFSRYLGK